MMNYETGEPNPRFWVLKLLKDNFGPEDKLVQTTAQSPSVTAQGFVTSKGRCILMVNKRTAAIEMALPSGFKAKRVVYVAPSTGDHAPASMELSGSTVKLEGNEVAVVSE